MSKNHSFKTEQEEFWAGEFGTDYINRNMGVDLLASNLAFFAKALGAARSVKTCVEFGANIGMNLKALKLLYPSMHLKGIEINSKAATELAKNIGEENVIEGSILDVSPPECDLALIKGVLIHIDPESLPVVYKKITAATRRYLLIAEYYNPAPVAIKYRGHENRLFKRDFAGEIMAAHPSVSLVDYGFVYRHDPHFPQDDITWFLLEKKGEISTY
jgi:pseudaminic acid biosynthesis-associated methylase